MDCPCITRHTRQHSPKLVGVTIHEKDGDIKVKRRRKRKEHVKRFLIYRHRAEVVSNT